MQTSGCHMLPCVLKHSKQLCCDVGHQAAIHTCPLLLVAHTLTDTRTASYVTPKLPPPSLQWCRAARASTRLEACKTQALLMLVMNRGIPCHCMIHNAVGCIHRKKCQCPQVTDRIRCLRVITHNMCPTDSVASQYTLSSAPSAQHGASDTC